MAARSSLSLPVLLLLAAALLALQAGILARMGQPFLASAAPFKLWAGNPLGPDNSQQLTDWYSLSHIVHGFLLYGALRLAAPRLPVGARLLLAMGIEIGWEVIENSPWVVAAYRNQPPAAGYRGDSVVNSVSDTVMMVLGFLLAARLSWQWTVLLGLGLELVAAWAIRDNLTLNIVNFLVSWPALEHWQAAWRP